MSLLKYNVICNNVFRVDNLVVALERDFVFCKKVKNYLKVGIQYTYVEEGENRVD